MDTVLFRVTFEDGKKKRKFVNQDESLVKGILHREYLSEEIRLLDNDIAALRKLTAVYIAPTPDNVLCKMPQRFRNLPCRLFLPQNSEDGRWENQPYKQSTYKPEERRHLTSRGLKVRSESELLIAEKLYEFQIPFHYEEVIKVGRWELSADFIAKRQGGVHRTNHTAVAHPLHHRTPSIPPPPMFFDFLLCLW